MKRSWVRVGIALLAFATGWAHAPSPGSGAAPEWTLPQRRVTVTYWDAVDGPRNDLMMKTVIPAYMRLHTAVAKEFAIKYEAVPDPARLLGGVAAGTGADLFVVPDWYLPNLYEAHALDPVPPPAWDQHSAGAVEGTYVTHTLDAQIDARQLYAVPVREHPLSLFVNNRMFRAAHLDPAKDAPRTWIDVAKLNTVLTKAQGGHVVQKGFEMRYAAQGARWPARLFELLLYQAGGEITRAGIPAFNSDAGVRALTVWRTLTVDPRATHNTAASPYQDFAAEQDAMMIGDPTAGAAAEAINPKMTGNYTVVPVPQMAPDKPVTIVYSDNWVVSAKAPADERIVAWDFVHFAATQPRLFWTAAGHLQPVRWYDPLAARPLPFLGVFIHELAIGRPLPRSTHYPELESALDRMIDRVFLNDADPKQALDQAASEYGAAYR